MPGRRHVLLGGAALVAGCASPRAATPEPDTMITVEGVALHFARLGAGPPVVLVHGASGNLADMTFRLGPALAGRHEVIAFDRPGLGLSELPPGGGVSIGRQAELMRAALAQMGIERYLLVGHSYGGSVALAWAVEAPETVQGLLLISAPSQIWEGGLGLTTDLLANPVTGPLLSQGVGHLAPRSLVEHAATGVFAPQAVPPDYLAHLDPDSLVRPTALRENARQLSALKDELRPLIPRYPDLPMPVELVHGVADTTVGLSIHSAKLVRQIPQARLTALPGVGHMPHQVATDAVVEAFGRLGTA
jgi:pimeloyl-ACP methyl ester carboxylesterase